MEVPSMKVNGQIEIDRPSREVFAFVSDQLNAPTWQKGLIEVRRLTEGPIGVGTKHTFVRKIVGRKIAADNEYYEYQPDRRVAFRLISGSTPGGGSYDVESLSPDRTKLGTSVELHPSGLARLAEPLMSKTIKKEVDGNLASLKELLERRNSALSKPTDGD
jgi:uncharacterized membrane protein